MPYKPKKRICQNCGKEFVIEPEDFEFYQKIGVPEPTFCPDCRLQRRLAFRNERKLYKRKCDLCGKDIISVYHKDVPFPVYCQKCWWSDKWDPMEYGRDYDFNKPFFEQLRELFFEVPRYNLCNVNPVNSEYSNITVDCKDCYLSNSTLVSENIINSNQVDNSKDCVDCFSLTKGELAYWCITSHKVYNSIFLIDCRECVDCSFLYDCRNCQNCFMSSNLRNKSYVFRNRQYDREEYFKKMQDIKRGNWRSLQSYIREFQILVRDSIHKYAQISYSQNAKGDYLSNCKDIWLGFFGYNSENIRYGFRFVPTKDSMDICFVGGERLYETASPSLHGAFQKFCQEAFDSHHVEYCQLLKNSSNLFGCIGLRHKQYCILNKQYTKEEYERLVPKIIEQMNKIPYVDKKGRVYKYGEFFPIELSPFSYNETVAQEYFPLTEEEAIKQGYSWYKRPKSEYKPTIKAEDLPDNIKDVDDSILNEIIECKNAKSMASEGVAERSSASSRSSASLLRKGSLSKNKTLNMCAGSGVYRILPQELEFYRKMNLPLPRLCPDCRHYERIKQRNPLKLYKRKCDKCGKEILTTYSPDRPEIVYCEACYLREIG